MNKKIIVGVVIGLILVSLAVIYTNKDKQVAVTPNKTKTISMGAILAMTGYAAADGEDIKNGIELAKADLAKQGVTLNVDYFDDATDPKNTITGINLMSSKGIKLIMGPTWGFQVTAALPMIKNKDIALLLPAQASDNVLVTSEKAFFAKPSTAKKQAPTETWLKQMNAKNVAVFVVMFSGDNWSEGHIKIWTDAVTASGAHVAMLERITLAQESEIMKTLLLKAKQNKVDAILWTGTDAGAVSLIQEMQKMNFKVPVLGTTQIEKVVSTGKVTGDGGSLYALMGSTSGEFADKFHAAYGADKRFDYAESAYDLTMLSVEVALTHGNDVANLAQYMKTSLNYSGFGGKYTFDARGDRPSSEWKVVQVK
jgi:branched-chain amino acid transport system substrate-binding protein